MPRGPLGMDTPAPENQEHQLPSETGMLSKRQVHSAMQYVDVTTRISPTLKVEFDLDFPSNDSIKCDSFSWISEPEISISSVEPLDYMILGYVKFATFYQVEGQIHWEVEHETTDGSPARMPYSIKFNIPIPITEMYLRKAIRGWLDWLLKAGTLSKLVSKYVHLLRIKKYVMENWPSICRDTQDLEKLLNKLKLQIRLELLPPLTDFSGGQIA